MLCLLPHLHNIFFVNFQITPSTCASVLSALEIWSLKWPLWMWRRRIWIKRCLMIWIRPCGKSAIISAPASCNFKPLRFKLNFQLGKFPCPTLWWLRDTILEGNASNLMISNSASACPTQPTLLRWFTICLSWAKRRRRRWLLLLMRQRATRSSLWTANW
jgi:hypothetical protein